MEDLLLKVSPYLDKFRGWLEVPSSWLAKALELNPERASWVVFGVIAFFIGKKIFDFFYTDTNGRTLYLVILVAAIFYVLKFLGAS